MDTDVRARQFTEEGRHGPPLPERGRGAPAGQRLQRELLDLGEINDSQQSPWRKILAVDRPIPGDAVNAVLVVPLEMKLCRPRSFGDRPGWGACASRNCIWNGSGTSSSAARATKYHRRR
jgi:hypothetical protein